MTVKSEAKIEYIEEPPPYSIVQMISVDNKVYRIRLPEFLKNGVDKTTKSGRVGTVRVETYDGCPDPRIFIKFNDNMNCGVPIELFPEEFNISFAPHSKETNYVFESSTDTGFVQMMGTVARSGNLGAEDKERLAKCRDYTKQTRSSGKKGKRSKLMAEQPQIYESMSLQSRKRETKDKRITMKSEEIRSAAISLFKSAEFWSIKDLVNALNQNEGNIRDAIKSITDYNEKEKLYTLKANYK